MNFSSTPGLFDVLCGYVLANRNVIAEANCKFLEWQLEHVAYVYLIRELIKEGKEQNINKKAEVEIYTPDKFKELKTVLDAAQFIYCFGSAEEFYGHMRANPTHRHEPIEPVPPTIVASVADTPKPNSADPDDYAHTIQHNKQHENPFVLGVDVIDRNRRIKRIDLAHAESTTTPNDVKSNESVRWMGILNTEEYHDTLPKPLGTYFSDQQMIRWRFKTCSLMDDVRSSGVGLGEISFKECITHASKLSWWCASLNCEVLKQEAKKAKEAKEAKEGKDDEDHFGIPMSDLLVDRLRHELDLLRYLVQSTYKQNKPIHWPKTKWVAVTQGSKKKMPVTSLEFVYVKKT